MPSLGLRCDSAPTSIWGARVACSQDLPDWSGVWCHEYCLAYSAVTFPQIHQELKISEAKTYFTCLVQPARSLTPAVTKVCSSEGSYWEVLGPLRWDMGMSLGYWRSAIEEILDLFSSSLLHSSCSVWSREGPMADLW